MTLYPYEQITFELFDFLESANGFSKIFSRIAYSSNIDYKKDLTTIKVYFEIGWDFTHVTIERQRLFKVKVKKIELEPDYAITTFGKDWLIKNKDSLTNQIISDSFLSIDYDTDKLKTETKKLLYLKEQLINLI
jgi:hypothetical protein